MRRRIRVSRLGREIEGFPLAHSCLRSRALRLAGRRTGEHGRPEGLPSRRGKLVRDGAVDPASTAHGPTPTTISNAARDHLSWWRPFSCMRTNLLWRHRSASRDSSSVTSPTGSSRRATRKAFRPLSRNTSHSWRRQPCKFARSRLVFASLPPARLIRIARPRAAPRCSRPANRALRWHTATTRTARRTGNSARTGATTGTTTATDKERTDQLRSRLMGATVRCRSRHRRPLRRHHHRRRPLRHDPLRRPAPHRGVARHRRRKPHSPHRPNRHLPRSLPLRP